MFLVKLTNHVVSKRPSGNTSNGSLISQRWSFIYTGVSVIIRGRITVGGTRTVYTHLSASSFPDRMAQIEQGMLGKLPSLSSSSSRSLQRTNPVVQRCLEEDMEKDDGAGAGAGFDCKRNVEQVEELEWDQIYSDRKLKTLRRRHSSWGVKEPCTDSAVVRELHWRPEKCKTWVSFN